MKRNTCCIDKNTFSGATKYASESTALVLLMSFIWLAQAAEWKPTKPIEFVAPFAPGGGSDVLARSIASIIEGAKLCPQPLIVVNRAGGSGLVGTTSVVQQKGNPYVLVTFIPGQAQAALVAGKGAPTFRELTPICNLALDEQLIVVKTDSPLKTIRDVIAEAKKRPGELTIGEQAPVRMTRFARVSLNGLRG